MLELEDVLLENTYQTLDEVNTGSLTGFVDWTESTLTGDEASRTVSIQPVSDPYKVYGSGKLYTKDSLESVVFEDVEGMHYVYFDGLTGVLKSTTDWMFSLVNGPDIYVSLFYWDAVNKEFITRSIQNERHGLMDGPTHSKMHLDRGLVILSELELDNLDTTMDGSLDTCCQFGRCAGSISDEDIRQDVAVRLLTVSAPIVYLLGTATEPLWRNAIATANTSLINGGTGRLMYNPNNAGSFVLAEVPNGHYVNYHSFITTSATEGKEEFVVPGNQTYASKSSAIVNQKAEILELVSNPDSKIEINEYHAIGSILLRTDDTYTNAAKAVIVPIGAGRQWADFRLENLGNGTASLGAPIIPIVLVREVTADFTFSEDDMEIHGNTANGKFIGTLPLISSLSRLDRIWEVQKISDDENPLIITIADIDDSQCGTYVHTYQLTRQGSSLKIGITEDGKYTFKYILCAQQAITNIQLATLSPELASTTLSMYGDVISLAAEDSVTVGFRYREVGELVWIDSTGQSVSAEAPYTEDVTVTAALDYEVQAIATDRAGTVIYGDVKNTFSNYYSDINAALTDGLIRYWDMQETSGVDTTAVEKMGTGEDLICAGGVTIASDTVNGNLQYKRVFTGSAFMQAMFQQNNTDDFTILIKADARTISGDHTVFSTGRNIFSLAADGTSIQHSSQGTYATWSNATPTGLINIAIRVRRSANRTPISDVTPSAVTQHAEQWRAFSSVWNYLKVGDGSPGDANHQNGEFFADGDVGFIACWNRSLSDAELMDIAKTTDVNGMLIV